MSYKPNLLIVDDHPLVRVSLARMFKAHATVFLADSNFVARHYIERKAIDLIISDINRPSGNGIGLLDFIRNNPKTQHMPFIFITGNADKETRYRALMQGCDEIIDKASSGTVVEYRVIRWLDRIISQKTFMTTQSEKNRPLRAFISYAREDLALVKKIWKFSQKVGVNAWLDEKSLVAGQDWKLEIKKALENTDMVLTCLSKNSLSKIGYVQKELRYILDLADYQPSGSIFVVPITLESCSIPDKLSKWHVLEAFNEESFSKLFECYQNRAKELKLLLPQDNFQKK